MYRRYTQGRGEGVSVSRMRHNRLRDIIILVLLLGLVALAWFAVPAIRNNHAKKDVMVQQIRSECVEAVEVSQKQLSRTAGTSSYYSLALIRGNLRAMQALDEAYIKAYNERLMTDDQNNQINSLLTLIKQYYDNVQAGADTGQFVTDLQTRLRELQQGLDN